MVSQNLILFRLHCSYLLPPKCSFYQKIAIKLNRNKFSLNLNFFGVCDRNSTCNHKLFNWFDKGQAACWIPVFSEYENRLRAYLLHFKLNTSSIFHASLLNHTKPTTIKFFNNVRIICTHAHTFIDTIHQG